MSDISHIVGGDILASGSQIIMVSGPEQTRQSILRRLVTNAGGYVWHQDYGAGLPARVGDATDASGLEALIQEQMALEASVDQNQPIIVTITTDGVGTVVCAIQYTDATTGNTETINV